MGLLGRAAVTHSEYLQLRDQHLHVAERIGGCWRRMEPQVREVTEQLEAAGISRQAIGAN
jgi:hypothetical protein